MTEQRRTIASVAGSMPGAFTTDELLAAVKRVQPLAAATATVYRAVAAMEGAQFLERVGSRDGSVLYAPCHEAEHHHHVVCDGCGRTARAECPVDNDLTAHAGFRVTRHEVTLYGLCRDCADKAGA